MPSAIHHQALHAASQTVVTNGPAWLNTLPPWAQSPIFLTFVPCFIVLVLLAIRHRVSLHRQGKPFTKSKTRPAELIGGALLGAALIYFQDKWPVIPLILGWPKRTFPWYREHTLEFWLGFGAAVIAANVASAMYAALFLRGGGGPRGSNGVAIGMAAGRHTLLPNPPDGYGWFTPPQTTHRITRQRTYHVEGE